MIVQIYEVGNPTEAKKQHSFLIIAEMKKSLTEIDKEIEKELK